MSEETLSLVIGTVVLVLFFGFSILFFFKLVPRMLKAAFGPGGTRGRGGVTLSQVAGGDWKRLAESWQTSAPPPARLLERQWVQVGLVIYRRSVSIGASEEGLYLQTTGVSGLLGLPPLLIPWSAITGYQQTRFQWMPAVSLTVAPPADTSIVFYKRVFDRLAMPVKQGGSP